MDQQNIEILIFLAEMSAVTGVILLICWRLRMWNRSRYETLKQRLAISDVLEAELFVPGRNIKEVESMLIQKTGGVPQDVRRFMSLAFLKRHFPKAV